MKKRLKIVLFVSMMVTIAISSKRIADYLIHSYEKGISYLAQATTETTKFIRYQ